MNRKWLHAITAVFITVLISSCGAESSSKAQGAGYKETKDMVMDILKSEDGKKAIKAASSPGGESRGEGGGGGGGGQGNQSQIKLLTAGDSMQLQMAVKDVLTAEENNKFLQDMMKDPKFAGDFAKAIQKETKKMYKDLLKDPEYQKSLVDVMKNPDYAKMVMDTMKTAEYRQQIMTVIQESMQSPLFRADLVQLLQTAMKEQSKPEKKEKGGGKGEGGGKEGQKEGGGGKDSGSQS